jgi:hypothetical protein
MKRKLLQLALVLLALAPITLASLTISSGTTVTGRMYITGSLSKSLGAFVIDHPLDPRNKLLYHSFVESPDMKNLYDGIATLDEKGEAVVELPSYFEALNRDFRYHYFPIGKAMPGLHVQQEISENRFILGGGVAGGKVSWQVTGTRHDPYARIHPLVPEVDKGSDEMMDKGECIYPAACNQ